MCPNKDTKDMTKSKVCQTTSSGDIWATVVVSVFAVSAVLYFDLEATMRLMNMDENQLPLAVMAVYCLVVAQIASLYGVHIHTNCPRELALLERYLRKGKMLVGDVHYPSPGDGPVCGSQNPSTGAIFYRHPNNQYKGCFIRRDVTLFQKYTRELETLLILPGEPYSAQPRSDLQGLLAVRTARNGLLQYLVWYVLGVVVCSILSAAYMVFVMTRVDTTQDKGFWRLYRGWIVFAASCCLIPIIAQSYSRARLLAFVEWYRKGDARFVQEYDDEYSTLQQIPCGVGAKNLPKEEI